MIEYNYKNIDQKVYFKEYDNGLKVYIVPTKNRSRYYVNMLFKYGSIDVEFVPNGKKELVKTPLGIAHFLEHKAFDMKDEDPFNYFANSGTSVNAGTNYFSTRYYLWGTNNIYENVDYLLTMLYSPYFDTESVEREKGIIEEEIKMYDDDPSWTLDYSTRANLFVDTYMREKIAGTVESIRKVTVEDLRLCYDNFYHPSNMVIAICGDFDYQKMFKIIEEHKVLKNIQEKLEIRRREFNEEDEVLAEFEKLTGNVVRPKFKYAFKINKDHFSLKDELKLNIYLNCIFSTLFGVASNFFEEVHKNKLTTNYYYEHSYFKNYYILEFEAESAHADILKDYIDETLASRNVSEEDLERHKKIWLASEIRLSDHVEVLVDGILEDILAYGKPIFDRTSVIKELNYQELKKVIEELDLEHYTFSLLMPTIKE